MNSCSLIHRAVSLLPRPEGATRKFLLLIVSLSAVAVGAQNLPTHTEPAMQCADTSKRDAGDVLVVNTCNFKITVQASTPEGTQPMRSLDPGGSSSIISSAHSAWRIFACASPGAPADETGKEVTYATVKYACNVPAVSAQTQQAPPPVGPKADAVKFYADAHPYMDLALPELKKAVRELGGLKPAPSQEQLPDILAKVAAKADELLHRVPDLISDETVSQTQFSNISLNSSGCVGIGCTGPNNSSGWDDKFNYLILTHPAQDGNLRLQEYRTGRNGKPIEQGSRAPNFQGFLSSWIIFSSLNQVESRFRYLGQQQTDGHNTSVIGFAQNPAVVESPGLIVREKESVPMVLQGIAWIDQSDFSIVRLRTDLLAPQPEIGFQRQTVSILFGPVRIPTLDLALWLPQAVSAEVDADGQLLQEEHKYSKYRLYLAKSKIILSPQ